MSLTLTIKTAMQTAAGLQLAVLRVPVAGLKYFAPPVTFGDIDFPERRKLKVVDRQPQYTATIRPPKMTKRLDLMRGPEEYHNFLIHKQYGIQALCGGRMAYNHFEMVRYTLGRKINPNTMFPQWRIDPPWLPVTKKGQGQRMGGGKGAIDHYVTPLKAGRIVLEIGGHCTFDEVKLWLGEIANKLPFKARAVSQEMLEKDKLQEIEDAKNNLNPYTMEYIIRNNMAGVQNWISPFDRKWFCKYR
ncbi:large ribosomal subunit protein uL16m [Neocloeon triangulifer]|uniref:large ribosomal subunit protein uL16m n=1 Tax=Neocloeon triangulifer TaxID=2078957 RepID=UPI00286F8A24|nr:large ribosomal subunit protein uL16m [Neocloeon triangulifer]